MIGSPFEVEAGAVKGDVIARGPGLQSAFTGRPAKFEVDTKDFPGRVMETKIYSKLYVHEYFPLRKSVFKYVTLILVWF